MAGELFVRLFTADPRTLKVSIFHPPQTPLLSAKLKTRFHSDEPLWVWRGEWILGAYGTGEGFRQALEIDPGRSAFQVLTAVVQVYGETLFAHPLEKAAVVNLALKLWDGPQFPLEFLTKLCEPAHAKRLGELTTLAAMTPKLQEVLVQKEIPLKTLLLVNQWAAVDQRALAQHFSLDLPVGKLAVNKVREYCEAVQEASMALNQSPSEILGRVVEHCPRAGEINLDFALRKKWLFLEAHPELAHWRRTVEGQARDLKVPGGMTLDLPENMEGAQIRAAFHFRTAQELRKWGEELVRISANPTLTQLAANL